MIQARHASSGPAGGQVALGERGASWDTDTAEFRRFFRVVTVDVRGHGDSDRPGVSSLEVMRDDVLAVLDHLGQGTVTLVGHSM